MSASGRRPPRRAAALLLAAEALLGLAWTVALVLREDLGSAFLPPDVPPRLIRTFLAADAVFYVVLPAAAAAGFARGAPWARATLLLHAGAVSYAFLWGLGLLVVTGHGAAGTALMAGPVVLSAVLLRRQDAARA